MDLVTLQLSFTGNSYFFEIQESGIGISTLYWAIFSEFFKISCKNVYSRVFVLLHFFFFFAVPLKLLSLNSFSALQYLLNFYFT